MKNMKTNPWNFYHKTWCEHIDDDIDLDPTNGDDDSDDYLNM